MILKPTLIYAEFLEHFLAVIQSEDSRNAATMLGGCLRSNSVSDYTKSLCKDNHYLPLSAVIKSGCVKNGMIVSNEATKRLELYYDEFRIIGALRRLGIESAQYNTIQHIILVACCQEASNRVLTGEFQLLAENTATISNKASQEAVLDIVGNLHVNALLSLMPKLSFDSDFKLTETSIRELKAQQQQFIEAAEKKPAINIPDIELMALCGESSLIIPIEERIQILDELAVLLTNDKYHLRPGELLEHEAQLHLIKLHCALLDISYKNLWQVRAQFFAIGDEIIAGDTTILLPYSISKIFDIIKSNKTPKGPGQYRAALHEIQDIARNYESDWYTWARNQISPLASSPAVKTFLSLSLSLDIGPSPKKEEPSKSSGVLTSVWSLGLGFFVPETAEEKDIKQIKSQTLSL